MDYSEGTRDNPTMYLETLVLHHMLHADFLQKKKATAIRFGKRNSETQRPENVQNVFSSTGIFGAS